MCHIRFGHPVLLGDLENTMLFNAFLAFHMLVFFKMYLFIYYFWLFWVFIAIRRFSLVCGEQGLHLVVVHRLLIAVASLVLEHGL